MGGERALAHGRLCSLLGLYPEVLAEAGVVNLVYV